MVFRFVLAALIAVVPLTLRGQPGDTNPQLEKVASVNFQDAISSSQAYKKMKEDLIKKSAPTKKAIAKQHAELETLRDRLSNPNLNDDERNNLRLTIAVKQKALEVDEQQERNEFQTNATRALTKLSHKATPVVENYAKANGYAVILDNGHSPNWVLFATDETVNKYGLKGKPPAEIENALLSVFSGKDAQPIDHELAAALDAVLR